jgi:hypothetical protein
MPTMIFTLKDYLNEEKQFQTASKRESTIPTMEQLAEACKMKVTPFSRMINNRTDAISRAKIALIIAELNRCGLHPNFEQLFAYYE